MNDNTTRRLFLKRAGAALGVVAFLPLNSFAGSIKHRSGERYFEHTILAMGATARLGIYATHEREANRIITRAFAELKRLEALFSVYQSTSDIARINDRVANASTVVSSDTLEIIKAAIQFSKMSDRAFDITVEPLMRLWGFRSVSNTLAQLPDQSSLERTLESVGYEKIIMDTARREISFTHPDTKLDLGGIAVGYALDKMAAILKSEGIVNGFLDISGDIIALGAPHTNSRGWEIGIPDPTDTSKIIHTNTITNQALATSGNYMTYVVYQARKFGHIIDPSVGRSATRVLSTTAIGSSGLTVDALSTASFVLGKAVDVETEFVVVGANGLIS